MKQITVLVAFVVALAVTLPVRGEEKSAAFFSGEALFEKCDLSEVYCIGYVTAIADVMEKVKPLYGATACFPEGTTPGAQTEAVLAWLGENPKLLYLNATSLIAKALAKAFPCEQ